jgi:hydroxymethylpyrimidine pyrophosphatase-like HAD family hydrolase
LQVIYHFLVQVALFGISIAMLRLLVTQSSVILPRSFYMHFTVLACDFDGTLAADGWIAGETAEALGRFVQSGRTLVMVTGRELPELLEVCPDTHLFHWIVAENGGLLYQPTTGLEKPLGPPPSTEFVATLKRRGVDPCSTGRVIVATHQPHETTVLETIRDLGLEMQVIFNKGAVMVLPSGINKATGLAAVLTELDVSPASVVAIGDGENDHALLESCGAGIAVANAVPLLKAHADWVTESENGAGVQQLIARLLDNDLAELQTRLKRKDLRSQAK